MMNEATRRFAAAHADDDVRQLALRGCKDPDVDLPLALQQIQGRQTARQKLPSWAANDGILYPAHLSMEQCSSEATARYKVKVAAVLIGETHQEGLLLVDLTGGFGVDFAFMSTLFLRTVYVEQLTVLHDLASQNFSSLGLQVTTVNGDSTEYLHQMEEHATLIFLDPARRDMHGGRTYGIADCQPNVLQLKDELLSKADYVMLKLSPMLDWRKAVSDVGQKHVEQVHIVSVGNECKELLLVLSSNGCDEPQLYCVNDEQTERFPLNAALPSFSFAGDQCLQAGNYLYEPNAALMKAGFFMQLAQRYAVMPIASNSHLFVSSENIEGFPGRRFRIIAVTSMNKRELREKILPLRQANISVRNFPMSVDELRRRLKLSEGGSNYLFATTLATGERVLIVTTR